MPILGAVGTFAAGFVASGTKSALSFLSIVPKFVLLVPAIVFAWSLLIGGTVQDLNISIPLTSTTIDLQTPTVLLADTIASIINIMPFMEVVFDILLAGLQIKILLVVVQLFFRIIGIFVQT